MQFDGPNLMKVVSTRISFVGVLLLASDLDIMRLCNVMYHFRWPAYRIIRKSDHLFGRSAKTVAISCRMH